VQNLKASGIKDSIRLAHLDLGNIHNKYGFAGSALNMWEKSFEASNSDDDQLKISCLILKTAFASNNIFYLSRFCEKARYLASQSDTQHQQTFAVM
jgi:hypothetical protein